MDISLERQIASASRSVEEARRMAYNDPSRTGDLVDIARAAALNGVLRALIDQL